MKEKNQLQNEFEQKNEAMQKKIHSLIEENSELKGINETKFVVPKIPIDLKIVEIETLPIDEPNISKYKVKITTNGTFEEVENK